MTMTMDKIQFGPDKSQILRGLAIIFMIILHNNCPIPGFKICVPIFTFLVGYGYAFASRKNIRHGMKRIWHLLSHFWLILLGIFLPVAILMGDYQPTIGNVLENMFGLESNLNWYSWYIYFYIYAMIVMIPISRIINRFKIPAILILICICFVMVYLFHQIPNWSDNIWIQAIHDCVLCSPVMFVGFYLADKKIVPKLSVPQGVSGIILSLALMIITFAIRNIPYMGLIDWIVVPTFCIATVALFNVLTWHPVQGCMIALGIESMNMWFLHALFATAVTAPLLAPMIDWIEPLCLRIVTMIIVSYLGARITTAIYNKL